MAFIRKAIQAEEPAGSIQSSIVFYFFFILFPVSGSDKHHEKIHFFLKKAKQQPYAYHRNSINGFIGAERAQNPAEIVTARGTDIELSPVLDPSLCSSH